MPLSNLVEEENNGSAQPAQLKVPRRCSLLSGLLNGRSVPCRRSTAYCAGLSCSRHCASVRMTSKRRAGAAGAAGAGPLQAVRPNRPAAAVMAPMPSTLRRE
ncbi:hypothetical protein D3C72_1808690 [compost metagenome]